MSTTHDSAAHARAVQEVPPGNVVRHPDCGGPVRCPEGRPYCCAQCGKHLPGTTRPDPGCYWEIRGGWLTVVSAEESTEHGAGRADAASLYRLYASVMTELAEAGEIDPVHDHSNLLQVVWDSRRRRFVYRPGHGR